MGGNAGREQTPGRNKFAEIYMNKKLSVYPITEEDWLNYARYNPKLWRAKEWYARLYTPAFFEFWKCFDTFIKQGGYKEFKTLIKNLNTKRKIDPDLLLFLITEHLHEEEYYEVQKGWERPSKGFTPRDLKRFFLYGGTKKKLFKKLQVIFKPNDPKHKLIKAVVASVGIIGKKVEKGVYRKLHKQYKICQSQGIDAMDTLLVTQLLKESSPPPEHSLTFNRSDLRMQIYLASGRSGNPHIPQTFRIFMAYIVKYYNLSYYTFSKILKFMIDKELFKPLNPDGYDSVAEVKEAYKTYFKLPKTAMKEYKAFKWLVDNLRNTNDTHMPTSAAANQFIENIQKLGLNVRQTLRTKETKNEKQK